MIWRKGEGWTYEREGITTGNSPKEQLELAKMHQSKKDYDSAVTAYRRLVRRWPTSSAVPDARMGLADSLSALGYHYKAFLEYQQLIEKHPSTEHFDEAVQRQFEIGNLFMAGERQKVWRIKLFPSVDKAVEIYERVIKNGPFSKVAPEAQLRIGLTREKQKQYIEAVHAYEKLLERYPTHPLAEKAQFHMGYAYRSEALRAEYDQNAANEAITAFNDYLVRFPQTDRANEADKYLTRLKLEQSKGLFRIGQFYEKKKNYKAALIYYNDVIEQNPKSTWASAAKEKVAKYTPRTNSPTATP